jgi:hypothetical protein
MVITDLDILLTNEDNEESSGFSSSTEILLGYRQDPARRGTTEYFK